MGELSGDWQDGGAPKREAEPSMEDILSSIKRIIAEDSEAQPERGERRAKPMSFAAAARSVTAAAAAEPPMGAATAPNEDVLELNEAMTDATVPAPREEPVAAPVAEAAAPRRKAAKLDALATAGAAEREPGPDLVSGTAALASRSSLDALTRLVVKPEVSGSDTLEGLVREMLRPMLSEWLDANLPLLVETMVAKEIARITGQAR